MRPPLSTLRCSEPPKASSYTFTGDKHHAIEQRAAPIAAVPGAIMPPSVTSADFLSAAGVQREGRGRPLLLINGLLHGHELWEPVVRPLAEHRQTIRFDFPHQNGSVFAEGYRSFDRYCDFIQELLSALRLKPAETEALGFSIGGDLLRSLVVERGVRFRHVIMAACAPPGIERFWKEFFTSALGCLRRGQLDTFVRLIAFQFYSPQYIERYPKLVNVMHLKYLQRFPDLRCLEELISMPLERRRPDPVCDAALCGQASLIHALYDNLVPIAAARGYARDVGLPVYEIESGHSMLAEVPYEFARLAIRILDAEEEHGMTARAMKRGSADGQAHDAT